MSEEPNGPRAGRPRGGRQHGRARDALPPARALAQRPAHPPLRGPRRSSTRPSRTPSSRCGRAPGKYAGTGEPAAWLWGIAVRRLVDALRKRPPAAYPIEEPDLGVVESAEDRVLLGVEHGDLAGALDRLSPELPRRRPGDRPRRPHHPRGRAAARPPAGHREDPHDARTTGSAEGARMTTWHLDRDLADRYTDGRVGARARRLRRAAPRRLRRLPRPADPPRRRRRGSTPCGRRSSSRVEAPRVGLVERRPAPARRQRPHRPAGRRDARRCAAPGSPASSSSCCWSPRRRARLAAGHAGLRRAGAGPAGGRGGPGVRPAGRPDPRGRGGVAVLPGPAARRPHRLRGRRPRCCRRRC